MTRAKEGPPTGDALKAHAFRVEVGKARVRAAMDHIQQAQVELNLAMMDLCSVIGYVVEGDKLHKLHGQIKDMWYRVEKKLERGPTRNAFRVNELDHDPSAQECANPHRGGCGRQSWKPSFFSHDDVKAMVADVKALDGCTDPDDEHKECESPCGLVGCDPDARRKA